MVPCVAKSLKTAKAVHQTDPTSMHRPPNVGVKLGTHDGSTCLETFLAGVRNFAGPSPRGGGHHHELFYLCASLRGPAGQLLWDLGPDVTLAELTRPLHQHFGTVNQA